MSETESERERETKTGLVMKEKYFMHKLKSNRIKSTFFLFFFLVLFLYRAPAAATMVSTNSVETHKFQYWRIFCV